MTSPWLRCSAGDPDPAVRLVCFAHAGGGASSFNGWRRALPGWIELIRVQLPGREDRRDEPPHTRVADLIAELYPHIEPLLDAPLVLYGHSVGSLIAFELIRELRRRGEPPPRAFVLSSRRAPHRALRDEHLLHSLPDDVLVGRVRELGGVLPGMLDDAKWRDHFLPRIRADLCLSDTYVYRDGPTLDCPLHAFIGEHDNLVVREDWAAWVEHATGERTQRVLPGGHFFSRDGQAELLGHIVAILTPLVGLASAPHSAA